MNPGQDFSPVGPTARRLTTEELIQRQWCSGNISAFQALALDSISGWRKLSTFGRAFWKVLSGPLDCVLLEVLFGALDSISGSHKPRTF